MFQSLRLVSILVFAGMVPAAIAAPPTPEEFRLRRIGRNAGQPAFEPFEEFSREATLVPLANTIATKVIDNGSRDFAPTIGGSKAIGGYGLSSGSRATVEQWAIWPIGEYAAFDESGTIRSINQQVYDKLERSSERPTRAGIPAAMVIAGLLGN